MEKEGGGIFRLQSEAFTCSKGLILHVSKYALYLDVYTVLVYDLSFTTLNEHWQLRFPYGFYTRTLQARYPATISGATCIPSLCSS